MQETHAQKSLDCDNFLEKLYNKPERKGGHCFSPGLLQCFGSGSVSSDIGGHIKKNKAKNGNF